MTIDEAIKLLRHLEHNDHYIVFLADGLALELGIEALKRVAAQRTQLTQSWIGRLPGETEE